MQEPLHYRHVPAWQATAQRCHLCEVCGGDLPKRPFIAPFGERCCSEACYDEACEADAWISVRHM